MSVVKLRLKKSPTHGQALTWLVHNIDQWPTAKSLGKDGIGPDLFHGWRFVEVPMDFNIYFANCIDEGIGEQKFLNIRQSIMNYGLLHA